jgi:hypothetical protein
MAFELPFPPFPHDSRDVPFIATPDDNNGYAVPSSQYFKKLVGEKYLWTPVSSTDPLPSSDAAAQAKLADILTKLSADPATQTTLAQILAKIIDAPATEAKQTALNALVGEVQAAPTPNTLLARLKNLETKVDAIIADGLKLSGSKGQVKQIVLRDDSEVAIGGSATITTVVPVGKKWTVLSCFYDVRSTTGTNAGTHRVVIGLNSASTPLINSFDITYNKWIQYRYGMLYDGNTGTKLTGAFPTDEIAQQEILKGLVLNGNINLIFVYSCKDVNIPQTCTRRVDLFVYEEDAI